MNPRDIKAATASQHVFPEFEIISINREQCSYDKYTEILKLRARSAKSEESL